MANVVPDSFKTDLLKGTFNFDSSGGSTFKLALYTDISGLTTSTTAFTATNEVSTSGTNYTSGGNTLANPSVTGGSSASTAFVDFDDTSFTDATFTARFAQIYRSDGSAPTNDSVLMLDFGGDFTATSGTFTIQFPSAGTSTAILRLA